jgi:hypothetical protein
VVKLAFLGNMGTDSISASLNLLKTVEDATAEMGVYPCLSPFSSELDLRHGLLGE